MPVGYQFGFLTNTHQKLPKMKLTPMKTFNVTYDIVTPESAEDGDVEDSGFVAQDVSLREALASLGGTAQEADTSPYSLAHPPRWFINYEYDQDWQTAASESRSLHLPGNITPSSAMRVARLILGK
jgi:hypothetical protein